MGGVPSLLPLAVVRPANQYMPKKPVKRGFKVWMLADAHAGYVSGFEVYTGKDRQINCNTGGTEPVWL